MGHSGDMRFEKRNLALHDHLLNGEDVHLFEEVPVKSGYLRYRYATKRICLTRKDLALKIRGFGVN